MLVSHPEGQNVKVRCEHLFLKLDITHDGVGQGLGSVVAARVGLSF